MQEIVHQLGELFLQAVPTVLIILLFYIILRAVFFKPLLAVMAERDSRTVGAQKAAQAAEAAAAEKIKQYQQALKQARGQVYTEQEAARKKLLEARAAHAAFDPATGRITLTCATQMPHLLRTAIADLLGFAESDLRVVAPDVGGGFGQKMSLPAEYVVLVWLARKLRDSVAWSEDRRENLIASFHSRDQHIELEGAFDAGGKLVALTGDVIANIGAYSCFPTTCGVEPLMAMAELPGPYDFRAYACRARGVATVIVTLGSRGAFVADGNGRQLVPGFKVKAVDTTAAGDIFNGALAVALAEGRLLTDSVRFANAAAALSVTKLGAQPSAPKRAQIDAFLKRAR